VRNMQYSTVHMPMHKQALQMAIYVVCTVVLVIYRDISACAFGLCIEHAMHTNSML
jgi:hypothetical protein